MKRIVSAFLSLLMCTAFCVPAFASSPDKLAYQGSIEKSMVSLDFSNMSVEELNSFIHSIAIQSAGNNTTTSRSDIISLAWIAAAEIASRVGYPCAGAVVKSSALGQDYIESNGLLAETIETTDVFTTWKSNPEKYIIFKKSDNSDLFYAIHKADISVTGNSSGARARITDTFDFEFETDMEDLFSTIVNDWGWLSQNIGALSEITVQVDITL